MTTFQPNSKYKKWTKNLDEIHNMVFFLQFNNKEFNSLANQYNNKKISFDLFRFARRNYVTFMSMNIRKTVDHDPRTISLINILRDIAKNSGAFKRSWFLKQFPDGEGETLFKEFFSNKDVLRRTVIKGDIDKLLRGTKKITDYANKWEAHWDKNRSKVARTTYRELDKAVGVVVKIYSRYYYLLKQKSISF